jgi:hypothetical protein
MWNTMTVIVSNLSPYPVMLHRYPSDLETMGIGTSQGDNLWDELKRTGMECTTKARSVHLGVSNMKGLK